MSETKENPTEAITSASKFPLVHRIIELVDFKYWYSLLRDTLIASNRKAGAYKGWVTKWKNKYVNSEIKNEQLMVEIRQLDHDKLMLTEQIRESAEKFKSFGPTVAKLERFEKAVDELRRSKYNADRQVHDHGRWSVNTMLDVQNALNSFIESVDEIMNVDSPEPPSKEAEDD